MKYITMLVLPDPRHQPGTPEAIANLVDYRAMIENALRAPLDRQAGVTIDEMRKSIRVLDALDATSGDLLQLEDADWIHLKEKVEKMPWAMVDRRILRFCDDVITASSTPPAPASTESPSGGQGDSLEPAGRLNGHSEGEAASLASGEASPAV